MGSGILARSGAFAAGCLALAAAAAQPPPALLLHGGTIHTGNPAQPRAEAVLSVGERIDFVGDLATARERAPAGTRAVDLAGATVLPGLGDSHAHLADIGARELGFDLTGVQSLAALQRRLAERAAADASPWIVGSNWIESKWQPAAFPSRADLDAVVRDRPVYLDRVDGHAAVVNSKALEIAGITRDTPDPPGGQILRDPATGEPTGMLIDTAMDLAWRHVPPQTDEQLARALESGAAHYLSLGWTQLQEAGTTWREIEQLCRLYASGRLKLRVYAAIGGPSDDAEKLLAAGRDYRSCDPRLTVRAIKLYMDGALGSRGAALEEPYADAPDNRGLYVTPPEEILRIAVAGLRRGIQVNTHAIGDRGNRVALDQFERAFAAVPAAERPVADPRFRIEHAQVLADADIPRFAELGVIASMQTSHAISDMLFAPARLGPERIGGAYAWRKVLDAGGRYRRAGRSRRPARRVLCGDHAPHAGRIRRARLGARPAAHARGGAGDPDHRFRACLLHRAGARHDRGGQARGFQRLFVGLDADPGSGDPALAAGHDGDRRRGRVGGVRGKGRG